MRIVSSSDQQGVEAIKGTLFLRREDNQLEESVRQPSLSRHHFLPIDVSVEPKALDTINIRGLAVNV